MQLFLLYLIFTLSIRLYIFNKKLKIYIHNIVIIVSIKMSNIPVNVALSVLLEPGYTSSRYIPPPPPKPVSDYLNILNRYCEIHEMKEEENGKWLEYLAMEDQQSKVTPSLISGGGCEQKLQPVPVPRPVPGSVLVPVPGSVPVPRPVPGSVLVPVPGSVLVPVPGSVLVPRPVPALVLQQPNGENFMISKELIKEVQSQLTVGEENAKFASTFISKINPALLPQGKPRKDGKGKDRGRGTITKLLELIPGVKSIEINNNKCYYL